MFKAIRYTLATICLTASVGCLALWWPSFSYRHMAYFPSPQTSRVVYLETFRGSLVASYGVKGRVKKSASPPPTWQISSEAIPEDFAFIDCRRPPVANFGRTFPRGLYFPLWYAAMFWAIAAVAALRLHRQFSIRSSMIVTAIVAVMIGVVVIM